MDLFRSLPRDIAINILSRLPIPSIIECKVVCKAWRDLIECLEFGNAHQQRHLIVFPRTNAFPWSKRERTSPAPYKIEELNNSPMGMAIIHMGLFDSVPLVRRSVDGLILLLRREWEQEQEQEQHPHVSLWVCNPITQEYVIIPNPSDRDFGLPYPPQPRGPFFRQPSASKIFYGAPPREYGNYNFGFGVSKSKQYKVVWISQFECRVYTLGTTQQWRSITVSGPGLLRYNKWNTECESVGGNLYLLDPPDSQTQAAISCFDLETEVFTYFSAPLPRGDSRHDCYRSLCVLDDCLCLCDVYDVYGLEIEIWLMRRQADWSKKLVISEHGVRCGCHYGYLFPIKVLEDDRNVNGMLLGTGCYDSIYYYSNNNNNNNNSGGGGRRIRHLYPKRSRWTIYEYPRAVVYTPSFLPLKTLLMDVDEDVRSF